MKDRRDTARRFPRSATSDLTVDDFIGEWWDRHAQVVVAHDEAIRLIPLVVRWVLPYLGDRPLSDVSRRQVALYERTIRRDGASRETVEDCRQLLGDIFACAVNWGRLKRSPLLTPGRATTREQGAQVLPFPTTRGQGPERAA